MVTASVTWHFLKFIIIWYNFCLSYLNFHLEMVSILFVLWSACVFYFSTWTGKMRVVWMIVAALHSRLCLEFIPNHLQFPFLSKLSAHYNVTSVGMNILLDEGPSLSCLLKLWPPGQPLHCCVPPILANSCQFLPKQNICLNPREHPGTLAGQNNSGLSWHARSDWLSDRTEHSRCT